MGSLLIFFTALGGSFAYMIPWFLPDHMWGESSFWVSQTFAMLVNPQVLYSFACVYIFLLLQLPPFAASRARHLLLIPLLAASIGFKSYGWVVLTFLYGVDLLWEVLTKRKVFSILIGVVYLLVSAPFVWLITHFKGGSFFYEPLWFINTMVEAPDRLNYLEWKFLEDHYLMHHNWARVFEIKSKEILIFFVGNLGTRALFFILLPLAFFRKYIPQHWYKLLVLAVIGFLFCSIFPLLFLQTGIVWNSIQFWYYALLFANVLMLAGLLQILTRLSAFTQIAITLVLVAFSLPAAVKTIGDKITHPQVYAAEKITALQEFSADDRVLICPEGTDLFQTSFVQAVSPATVYLSDPVQLSLVSADTSAVAELETLFSRKEEGSLVQFVKKHTITRSICSEQSMSEFITSEFPAAEHTEIDTWNFFSLKK